MDAEQELDAEQAAWRGVSFGLSLKLAALWLFLLMPVAWAAVRYWELPAATWLLPLLLTVIAVDLVGRCLCLSAPTAERTAIVSSVACQATGVVLLIGAGVALDFTGLIVALIAAGCLQVPAAYLFTMFLGHMANRLGRPDLMEQITGLQRKLTRVFKTSSGFAVMAVVAWGVFLVVLVLTCGLYGYLTFVPSLLLLIPSLLFTVLAIVGMYQSYGSTMLQLRHVVREQYGPGLDDENFEDGESEDGFPAAFD